MASTAMQPEPGQTQAGSSGDPNATDAPNATTAPADAIGGTQPDPDATQPRDATGPTDQHTGGVVSDDDPDTFPRSYVERLRRESAGYRERANRADELAAKLHTGLVRATGRLADPSDLPFDAAHLDDAEALSAAIDELLSRKPHLASRRPAGDIGQGAHPSSTPVDLASMLRARA